MILEYDVQGGGVRYREAICVGPGPIEVEVAKVMRHVISRYHERPRFVRFVITPEEWNRIRSESSRYLAYRDWRIDRFMGVPLSIEEDRYPSEVWYDEWTRHLAIDLAMPGSDRTVMYSGGRRRGKSALTVAMIERARNAMRSAPTIAEMAQSDCPFERANARLNQAVIDDIYRVHGGTKEPPSKRAPSKLHPLVQLDEAIGRDMTKGDT